MSNDFSSNLAEASKPVGNLVGRLAPAPTGAQHVGNARTYLLAWLAARSRSGKVIVRIEDLDSPRIKPWAADQALDDLHWLGLDWDEGPDRPGSLGPYVQSERLALYHAALEQLKQAEQVYPCTCTRSDVAAAASAPHHEHEGPVYPGTCAGRRVADAAELGDRPFAWRLRTTDVSRRFDDVIVGTREACVAKELGDFVIARSDGSVAYQLAVVIDDHAMGVTKVVRGDDLIPSTFRQLELYAFFGWQPPRFAHVPLVVGSDGRRLAKRHGDTRLSQLRSAGVSPERLVGLLAWSCGLQSSPQACKPSDLLSTFSFSELPRMPWVFDQCRLNELVNG